MSETMIQTVGLTKRYGEKTAVNQLNLSIKKGEVFGLLGPNGAGKTTTTLMLLGLTEPTEGFATIAGRDCTRDPIGVKRLVGYLPDNVGFYGDMTGRENLYFTGRLNGLSEEVIRQRTEELLDRVGMTDAADRKTKTYSRGMKQRLGIADVLLKDPEVVIMDEPTLGIDPQGMRELLSLIRELSEKDGRTILLSSHQLYQVQQICDRVGIFVNGSLQVQQICDRVGIFVNGSLIACGTISELGKRMEREGKYTLELSAEPDNEALASILSRIEGADRVEREGGRVLLHSREDIRRRVTMELTANGYTLLELHQKGGDLDEIYSRYFEKAEREQQQKESQKHHALAGLKKGLRSGQ